VASFALATAIDDARWLPSDEQVRFVPFDNSLDGGVVSYFGINLKRGSQKFALSISNTVVDFSVKGINFLLFSKQELVTFRDAAFVVYKR